jgi:long-subunit fatty acid transport protein
LIFQKKRNLQSNSNKKSRLIMKKILLIFVGLVLAAQIGFAGGIVTNTNQSTSWTRMLVRDASTQIDAVFYNPAGLVKLEDGFHFSVSNQFLFQKQTITNSNKLLNNGDYVGNISAPIFPGVYGAWKKGRVAVSVGFNPIGGGGGASFDNGLPSMETPFAGLVPMLGAGMQPVFDATGGLITPRYPSAYNMNMSFEGTSVYFGVQAGVSFEITENISVFAGARYVWAKNTYKGAISGVTVDVNGEQLSPGNYVGGVQTEVTGLSEQAAAGALQANGAAQGMDPIINAGGSGYTLAELEGAGFIDAATRAQLEGGLILFGIPQDQINQMDAATVQGTYYSIGSGLESQSQQLAGAAQELGAQVYYLNTVTADQEADVVETGNGITPIVGANVSLLEDKLNFGIKYEFQTKMDLTTEVIDNKGFVTGVDDQGQPTYMFVDGEVTNADIPAYLSVGVQYSIIDPLRVQLGYHTYFDKNMEWSKAEDGTVLIDKNFAEYGIGLEYDITESLLISGGFLMARTGANENYQSDLSYSLSTNTFGGGFAYKINDKLTAQIGGFFTSYMEQSYDKVNAIGDPYQETYDKQTWAVSIGVDFSL